MEKAAYDIKADPENEKEIMDAHFDKGRHPVVIFSQFKQFLHIFNNDLKETKGLDLKVETITGDNANQREQIKQRFQRGEIDVLLIQTDTVKVGVSLFRSNTAIFVDRKYSNQDMKQAVERIQHPASKDVKMTYFLMTENTIDDKVKETNDIKEGNTVYVNDQVMADLTGSDVNKAKKVFENYLNKIF